MGIHIPILTPVTRPVSEVLQKEKPVIRRQIAMQGNVNKSKFLRPKVSI
jgi:Na+-translocating ferredoxin:NAD+ oxidoreductase RnfC subunit